MIEKCAEAHALRMGFASETAGLNIEEEAAAIRDVTVSAAKAVTPNAENKGEETVLHEDLIDEVNACTSVEALQNVWESQAKNLTGDAKHKYNQLVMAKKIQLQNGGK